MYDYEERGRGYLTPLFNPQSYKNLAYMLISFPLGLIYFIGLIMGFSLGIGMAIILVGIPIILVTLALSWMAVSFERTLSNTLLDTDIPVLPSADLSGRGGWRENLLRFSNWKGIGYLLVKFPFGVLSFVMAVLTITIPLGLIASPLGVLFGTNGSDAIGPEVTSLPVAMIVFVIGLIMVPGLLFINNRLMDLWRMFTVAMLMPSHNEIDEKAKRDYRGRVSVPDRTAYDAYDYDDGFTEKPKRSISDLLVDEPDDSQPKPKRKRKSLAELLADIDEDDQQQR